MYYTLILSAVIIAFAVLALAVKIIFVKGGKFPNGHIGGNKNMKARGIGCSMSTDAADRHKTNLCERINKNK